jgi:UDP:flavonoid glycosyltransferase YjiC (YdhE family)
VTGRFIFTSWDGGGNTTPAFNLARRLMPRGHEVLMLGWPSMATRAADARIPFASYAGVTAWPEGNLDDDWERVTALLGGDEVEADIVRRASDFDANVVVVDCMMAAASRASHQLGLASSVLCHALYRPFRDEWGDLVLGDVKAMLDRATQVLIVVPPGFDTPGYLPPGTEYVGPICEPHSPDASRLADWDLDLLASSDETWVLLSLSTTLMNQTRALGPMLEALGSLPVRVLLTLGGAVDREDVAVPHNVVVRDVVPHDFVLPFVNLVLSHGGLSTVTATLSAGKPLVLIPQGRDQSLNAQRVEACGVGLSLDRDATPSAIAEAVTTVLENPEFATAAQQFAESNVGLGRGELATLRLEGLLSRP